MCIRDRFSVHNAIRVEGYEGLYDQLGQAGLCNNKMKYRYKYKRKYFPAHIEVLYILLYFSTEGSQGFPMCAVIDEPNMRVNGWTSVETSVHLICQRSQGMQHPTSEYRVVNCEIEIRAGFGRTSASIPNLMNVLSAHITQVMNLFSLFFSNILKVKSN